MTTNNQGIADFKKGVFILDTPVKIYYFKYNFDIVNPCLCYISTGDNIFLMLIQLRQKLTVRSLKGSYHPVNFTNWEEFAQQTKSLMCKVFQVDDFYGNYEEKVRAEKLYTPFQYPL